MNKHSDGSGETSERSLSNAGFSIFAEMKYTADFQSLSKPTITRRHPTGKKSEFVSHPTINTKRTPTGSRTE